MFKTEDQINERLNSKNNLVNRFGNNSAKDIPGATHPHEVIQENNPQITVIPLEQPGNKAKPKLDAAQKNEIAVRSRLGEKQHELAKEFKVSQSAIGEIEQGRTKVNEDLVQAKINEVGDVAMTKLLCALDFITPEKLEKSKATDLSMIASNMSKVVNNVRGKDSDAPKVIVQIYAPELKSESSFRTISV